MISHGIPAHSATLLHSLVDAIVNTGPREDSTRIGSQGTVRRQAVDVSPLRRVNQAISLITIGVRESAFRSQRTVAECQSSDLQCAAYRVTDIACLVIQASLMSSLTPPRDLPTLTLSRRRSACRAVLPSRVLWLTLRLRIYLSCYPFPILQ